VPFLLSSCRSYGTTTLAATTQRFPLAAGTSALTVALVHHGSSTTPPAWYCVLGGLGGLAAVVYALTSHAEISAIPIKCKIATATGIALLAVGSAIAARK